MWWGGLGGEEAAALTPRATVVGAYARHLTGLQAHVAAAAAQASASASASTPSAASAGGAFAALPLSPSLLSQASFSSFAVSVDGRVAGAGVEGEGDGKEEADAVEVDDEVVEGEVGGGEGNGR